MALPVQAAARVVARAVAVEAAVGEVAARVAGTRVEAGLEAASVVVGAVVVGAVMVVGAVLVGRAPCIGSGASPRCVGSRRTRQRAGLPACTAVGSTCASTLLARA